MKRFILSILLLCLVPILNACNNNNVTASADVYINATGNSQIDHILPNSSHSMNNDVMPFENKGDYYLYENVRTGYTASVHTPVFEKAAATADIIGVYEPGTEVQVLGDSPQWYYIKVDGVTGYTPFRSLAFNHADVCTAAVEGGSGEDAVACVAEQHVTDGTVSVRFMNKSENEQIVYDSLILPYDREGTLLPDQIRILSVDMNPPVKSGELSMEGLKWNVEKNVCTINICLLNVVYWDNDSMKTWYNPYAGDWLLARLEEAGLR